MADTEWRIGIDAPGEHPMWEQQVALEKGMLHEGANRVKDRTLTAQAEGQMTRLAPVRALITEWLPTIARGIREWCQDAEKQRGPKHAALRLLKPADPYVAGLIGLQVILDRLGQDNINVTAIAMAIGQTLEHELKIERWEAEEPELYYKLDKMLTRDKATTSHRARVNINRFNHHLAKGTFGFGWDAWSNDDRFRAGCALVDVILRYTSWFEIVDDPHHRPERQGRAIRSPKLTLLPKPGLMAYIASGLDSLEINSPIYGPTLMPPKRWDGTRSGGYYTPYVRPPRLIRFKASQEHQRSAAADEYEALDMPAMYQAIHMLQEVPWVVNERVLAAAIGIWPRARKSPIAGLPQLDEEELPDRSAAHSAYMEARQQARQRREPDPEESEALTRDMISWKRRAKRVRSRNAKRGSKLRAATQIITTAQAYVGKEFYFPHMLDFRGRLYPIPTGLSPQGNDLARGLLLFANRVEATEENGGERWLAVHVANCWGEDKLPLEDRVAWAFEKLPMLRKVDADPLAHLDWTAEGIKTHFQALAATIEWCAYLRAKEAGERHYSQLPVMVDGTCNGIQHLSAITRDQVSGRLVNLVPADSQQDIYGEAAARVQKRLEKLRGDPLADYWLDLCNGKLPRSLTKRQTMVLPYGGTKDSCFGYTLEWLDAEDPAPDELDPELFLLRMQRVGFLSTHLWDVLNELVSGGMRVMKWLQMCAKEAADAEQPIWWTTPAGFTVRHFYGKVRDRCVDLKLNGVRHQLRVREVTKELDKKAQLTGVAPNFIHSLDAAALVTCLSLSNAMGLSDVTTIHDAYGTHAANMDVLSSLIRTSFVDIHNKNPLDAFRAACSAVMVDLRIAQGRTVTQALEEVAERLPPPLHMGSLDLKRVLESDYFFA